MSKTLFYVRLGRWTVRGAFAWYDMWVGAFWDQQKEVLYVCPLPCCVLQIKKWPVFDLPSEANR